MKKLWSKFRGLSGLGKFVVAIVALSLLTLIIALIIAALTPAAKSPKPNPAPTIDPTSGQTVDNTNTGAVVPPGPKIIGLEVLLKRGLSSTMT